MEHVIDPVTKLRKVRLSTTGEMLAPLSRRIGLPYSTANQVERGHTRLDSRARVA
jgi:hypothetical protein